MAERKFAHPFTFPNHAKLIFVTNELPRTTDKTAAFYRRLRVIEFPYTFEGNQEDKSLLAKITRAEREGLAFKSVGILQNMIARNFSFTNQKATSQIETEYEKQTNPIDTFISEECELDDDGFISKMEFKKRLDAWMKDKKHRVRDDKEIAQRMRDKGISDQKRTFVEGNRSNAWCGIRWKG